MPRNAKKNEVSTKLEESLAWCNSNHDDAQERFDTVADSVIEDTDRNREMKALYPVLLQHKLKGYLPSIPMPESSLALSYAEFLDEFFRKWCTKYRTAWLQLPSERIASPKESATDQALIKMVETRAKDEASAIEWATIHNLFMKAEIVGGNLLEEYIYRKVCDYDWIWCRGEVLTAVDFCSMSSDEPQFIQIKNKSNTENSSSAGFRIDHHADKWYRMNAKRTNGVIVTHWPKLIEVIQKGTSKPVPADLLTEEDYLEFVRSAAERNPALITEQEL